MGVGDGFALRVAFVTNLVKRRKGGLKHTV
jgi:hypothetical protein